MRDNGTQSARLEEENHAAWQDSDKDRAATIAGVNLAARLLATGADDPERVALIAGSERTSYGALTADAGRLAALLTQRFARGDRVVILAGNEPAFVTAYLAVVSAGLVAVPLDPQSPAAELGAQVVAVAASGVLASPEARRAAEAATEAAPGVAAGRDVVVVDRANLDAAPTPLPPVEVAPGDLAALLFTSGTAGAPRPAMLTHGCLAANIDQVLGHQGLALRPDDVTLGALPFFHVFGLNVVLGVGLAAGATLTLVPRFEPAAVLAQLRRDGVTVVAAVPAMYAAWLALPGEAAPSGAFSGVRLAVSGAAALPVDVADSMRERFGVVVHQGYGLTEASPIVTTAAVGPEPHPASIGPPLPGVKVRVVDVDGRDVLEGDAGEIWVRGPNVFAGYWDDPDATAQALTADGWLRTGDVAVADERGWLTLVDRVKDLVIVSGFNVYPAEVEDVLRSHPDVAHAAVVGEAHERTGEAVVAYVVASPGASPDPDALVAHAAGRLARYKVPSRVEIVDTLPRSLGGKVRRSELRGSGAPQVT